MVGEQLHGDFWERLCFALSQTFGIITKPDFMMFFPLEWKTRGWYMSQLARSYCLLTFWAKQFKLLHHA